MVTDKADRAAKQLRINAVYAKLKRILKGKCAQWSFGPGDYKESRFQGSIEDLALHIAKELVDTQ